MHTFRMWLPLNPFPSTKHPYIRPILATPLGLPIRQSVCHVRCIGCLLRQWSGRTLFRRCLWSRCRLFRWVRRIEFGNDIKMNWLMAKLRDIILCYTGGCLAQCCGWAWNWWNGIGRACRRARELNWIDVAEGGRLLWTRQCTCRFHKMWRNCWTAKKLSASQVGVCFMGWWVGWNL